ncbi:MAG TPA: arginine repressor [Gammaproteobacteria bacterium]|jgi:transcriptional regulator of arginine metabolism|nr:arginine repressor [Gammaproteobacteria bacterium]
MNKKNHARLIVAIQTLLQKEKISTQEDLKTALHKQGFDINQVQISRILHKLNAIKMNEGEQTVYRLATAHLPVAPTDSLKHLILTITHNESLIVIHTTPGSAQLVARLLDDKAALDMGILGTVAGDDTIFIAPEKMKVIKKVFERVCRDLLG